MIKMKTSEKQLISFILCAAMVFSFLTPCAFAGIEPDETSMALIDYGDGDGDPGGGQENGNANPKEQGDGSLDNPVSGETGNQQPGNNDSGNAGQGNPQKSPEREPVTSGYGAYPISGNTNGEPVSYGLFIGETEVTSLNCSGNDWEYDADKKTLTLSGGTIEETLLEAANGAAGIYWAKDNDLTVSVSSDTSINYNLASNAYDFYGIYNAGRGMLIITGPGKLTISSGSAAGDGMSSVDASSYGIFSNGGIEIASGAHVESAAGSGISSSKGVYSNSTLTVDGVLYAEAGDVEAAMATDAGSGRLDMNNISAGVQAHNIHVNETGSLTGVSNASNAATNIGVCTYANNSAGGNISSAGTLSGTGGSAGILAESITISGGTATADGIVGISGNVSVTNNSSVTAAGSVQAFSETPTIHFNPSITHEGSVADLSACITAGTVVITPARADIPDDNKTDDDDREEDIEEEQQTGTSAIKTDIGNYLTIKYGEIRTVKVELSEGVTCSCQSSNPSIVTVTPSDTLNESGAITLTACSVGDAVITLTANTGEKLLIYVHVPFIIPPVEMITLSAYPSVMQIGDKVQITVNVYPLEANPTYTVESSNKDVISCPEGERYQPTFDLEALKSGTSRVTVKSASSGVKPVVFDVMVLPEGEYSITEMSGAGTWQSGIFTVTCNGPQTKFTKAVIDAKEVPDDSRIVSGNKTGTSDIQFTEKYMDTLDAGTHYLELYFNDGKSKAVTVFYIPQKKVSPEKIIVSCPDTVEIGKTVTATVTVLPDTASSKEYEVTVTQGNECVTVGELGESSFPITGKEKGTATFLVKSTNPQCKPTAFSVNVVEESVPAAGITAVPGSNVIEVNGETTVQVSFEPESTTSKSFRCITADTDIVEISEVTENSFKVSGKTEGMAVIDVAWDSNPDIRCPIAIYVVSASVLPTGITVTPESDSLSAGKSMDVGVRITPEDATNKAYRVSVESDEPDVVYVESGDLTGPSFKVLGLGAGTARLTVSSVSNPNIQYSFDVSCDVKVEKINTSKNSVFLGTEECENISVSISPSGASNKRIRAYSEDPEIARLDPTATEGIRIVGVSPGETKVILAAKDGGGAEKDIHVTVSGGISSMRLTDLYGNPAETVTINEKYGTEFIVVQTYPDVSGADVMWSSSNPMVAYVLPAIGGSGNTAVITGYGSGTAMITAEAGNAKATCTVNVGCGEDYYEITYKDNSGTWYYDYPSDFTVRCSSPQYALYGVQIDGIYLGRSDYSVYSDSSGHGIVLTIPKAYMKTLSNGRHLLTLSFNNGAKPVSTYIFVQSSKDPPKTGDSGTGTELLLMMISAGFLATGYQFGRKKKVKEGNNGLPIR